MSLAALEESMLGWCKTMLAGCRRPYGIDHFDLAIALRVGQSRIEKRLFSRLRPLSLYQSDLANQLRRLLNSSAAERDGETVVVSAALFSWGEAAAMVMSSPP